jgi:hypothetical protein
LLIGWTVALLSSTAPRIATAVLPPGWLFYASKGLHIAAYASLGALVWWLSRRWSIRAAAWLVLVAHGALTEYCQQFVPGRHASLSDVGLDTASIAAGMGVGIAWRCLLAWRGRTGLEKQSGYGSDHGQVAGGG